MNKDTKVSSDRLKAALADAGMKAIELAELSGINRSTVSHYVNGKNIPTNINAMKMATVLGVEPAWLMGLPTQKVNTADADAGFIAKYHRLDEEDKDTVDTLVDTLLAKSKYKKSTGNEETAS